MEAFKLKISNFFDIFIFAFISINPMTGMLITPLYLTQ